MGYNKSFVLALGMFWVTCNILLNFDNGALPACLNKLMDELHYDKVEMGSLGSYVYFGFVIGSMANGSIFVRYLTYKQILLLSFSLNGCGALLFTWVVKYYALAFARFMCGFGTTLFCIYHPLYVETFQKHNKGIWLPVLTLCGPLGTTIGYATTGGILSVKWWNEKNELVSFYHWNDPFYGLFLACCIVFLIIIFIPADFINIDEA